MSRAGLVSLIVFCLFVVLTASAPLPQREPRSLVERFDDYDTDLDARSLAIIFDREFDTAEEYSTREYLGLLDDREFDIMDIQPNSKREYDMSILDGRDFDEVEQDYTKREDADVHILHRRSIFSKIKKAFKKLGHKIKKGFQKVGKGIKKGFQKIGKGLKKAGGAIKKGFKKVGKFIKKTAGKIAKVALKIGAAVASVAAKVVKFIPGVGTAASLALKGVAMGANAASNKIHANIGKFGKFTKGLDYVINPLGSAAKAAGKSGKVAGIAKSLLF
ncbi:hypothetical protein GALMADRAFT_258798 [Galerina marginata CBS 339.88]|uniref:Uncharacterized protein n=1 Tax=Galerina marginata (strain CBS 339.88) TaxID=685588 RepID=A0A067SJI2_GALM3|nr:hypothetical protein GALMADRAFT_258798 [Galerina marginata CBS 339.88]